MTGGDLVPPPLQAGAPAGGDPGPWPGSFQVSPGVKTQHTPLWATCVPAWENVPDVLVLSLGSTGKRLALSFLCPPLKYLYTSLENLKEVHSIV